METDVFEKRGAVPVADDFMACCYANVEDTPPK